MRFLILAAIALLSLPAAAQPLTEAEGRRILETPLSSLVGPREADRVQRIAVVNGLLRRCRWRWETNFDQLLAQHREGLRRPENELQRLVIWHGFWQGQAQQAGRQERPACEDTLRASLREQASVALRAGPQR